MQYCYNGLEKEPIGRWVLFLSYKSGSVDCAALYHCIAQKGYGYIIDEQGYEVFVRYSEALGEFLNGPKTLSEGTSVEYEIVEGPRGREALRVHIL